MVNDCGGPAEVGESDCPEGTGVWVDVVGGRFHETNLTTHRVVG